MCNVIRMRRGVAVLVFILLLAAGGLAGALATARSGSGEAVPILVASAQDRSLQQVSFQNGFVPVVRSVAGAVVNVSSSRMVRSQPASPFEPFLNDPALRGFFGERHGRPREQRETSLGSGVIISPNGYILTNYHVIEGSSDVKVVLNSKQEYRAKVIGTDEMTDVAVLKVDATGLPVIRLGDSRGIEVGDFCLALGSPFGLGQTVTFGIISATGRSDLGIETPGAYEDFIQTDAAINPGNSGGPLVNVRGELIGINTAILSKSGGNVGIGFAVPINLARQAMDQIIQHGKVTRAYMGILPQEVSPAIADAFGLRQPSGVLVGNVEAGSPAAKAGIQRGDILLAMNGKPITDLGQFRIDIGLMRPGSQVQFLVFRNGAERQIAVTLAEMPASEQAAPRPPQPRPQSLDGLSLRTLTPEIAGQLELPANTKGVVVADVAEGSAAEDAGLEKGDVVLEVNRKQVANVNEFRGALNPPGGKPNLLLINRGGTTLYATLGD
jgi:serine protease Do